MLYNIILNNFQVKQLKQLHLLQHQDNQDQASEATSIDTSKVILTV